MVTRYCADMLLIRPHPVGQAGAGDHEDTSFTRHTSALACTSGSFPGATQ